MQQQESKSVQQTQDEGPYVTDAVEWLVLFSFIFSWIGGIVLAKGWVSTTCAVLFFPWSWYLFVERLFEVTGLLT